jgi:hypothetical protein
MRATGIAMVFLLLGCNPDHGERCNPLEFSDVSGQGNCPTGLSCIYPTAFNCGVAYCCMVDAQGNISDSDPHCQPDPTIIGQCGLDLSVADAGQD